jgi:hypothetical protein
MNLNIHGDLYREMKLHVRIYWIMQIIFLLKIDYVS